MFVDELENVFVPQFQVDLQGFVVPLVICATIVKHEKNFNFNIFLEIASNNL